MLKRIAYPILYVSNMAIARAFYENLLGFSMVDDSGDFVELQLGNSKLALNAATDDTKRPGFQTILIDSDDIDADYALLRDSVSIEMPLEVTDYGKTFIFRDPDGNKLEIVQEP
ncbi:MAG TPA: VOC family protein [Streptosporangiaceae bacterium]